MKTELLDSINEINAEIKSLSGGSHEYEYTLLIVDSVINSPIVGNLLYFFWQRSSDACPLECSEAEKQEVEFKEWVKTIDFDFLFKTIDKK